jgi:hypothetical protein
MSLRPRGLFLPVVAEAQHLPQTGKIVMPRVAMTTHLLREELGAGGRSGGLADLENKQAQGDL